MTPAELMKQQERIARREAAQCARLAREDRLKEKLAWREHEEERVGLVYRLLGLAYGRLVREVLLP